MRITRVIPTHCLIGLTYRSFYPQNAASDRQWRTRLGSSDVSAATDYGDVEIREDDLSSLTDAELKKLRITRPELHRLFAKGVEFMKSRSDRVRPVAHKTF